MEPQFEKTYNLCLLYSDDLTKLLLREVKNDKLDALLIEDNGKVAIETELSKIIFKELDLKIEPGKWQLLITLPQIERKWQIRIYVASADISSIDKKGFVEIDPANLPDNCHPNLKWLVPYSLDLTIYRCQFNQVLMK
jgi:hypothetical protein